MQRFFSTLADSGVETIIFDSPPLLGLSDASILASKVDGTLIVADITRANKRNLQQVKAALGMMGTRTLGCVVNKQRRRRAEAYYYYAAHEQNGAGAQPASSTEGSPVLPTADRQGLQVLLAPTNGSRPQKIPSTPRLAPMDDRKGG
jgi:non-specific protein-tyrosine kinase